MSYMHELEPFYSWENTYRASEDERSPFFGVENDLYQYSHDIYGYYIHPSWDYIGSETLYLKLLYTQYEKKFAIIELFGEWNDTLHNDVMHLKRNVIDHMVAQGVKYFVLLGENILNFHGSDDCYYEEWFEDVEEGWIAMVNFREFVLREMGKYGIDQYVHHGGDLDEMDDWRTISPLKVFERVNQVVRHRLG